MTGAADARAASNIYRTGETIVLSRDKWAAPTAATYSPSAAHTLLRAVMLKQNCSVSNSLGTIWNSRFWISLRKMAPETDWSPHPTHPSRLSADFSDLKVSFIIKVLTRDAEPEPEPEPPEPTHFGRSRSRSRSRRNGLLGAGAGAGAVKNVPFFTPPLRLRKWIQL